MCTPKLVHTSGFMNIIFPRFYNLKKGFWELTDKLNLAALFAQEKKMKASFLQKTWCTLKRMKKRYASMHV